MDIRPTFFIDEFTIPLYILNLLDRYFKQNNLIDRFQAVNIPIDCYGQKRGTSLKIMARAFINLHLSPKITDLNMVASCYWGWQLVRPGDNLMLPLKESDWTLASEISNL